ncbi:MAG: endonuclease I, partial [Planctomycetota bacterium]
TSGATDTWNVLELAQQDPNNAANIVDIYLNACYPKQGGGNSLYNREHIWPSSYGFPDDNSSNYPYTDCHMLRLCNDSYNSSRSNKPYRYCSSNCSEKTTLSHNGMGGGSGTYPGNSNWTSGSFTNGTWEVWIERRGDIARSMLYADLRYEGGNHSVTNISEPDLILTDNQTLIQASNTGNNLPIAYMGMLSDLLQWHADDPVDDWERDRNDTVYAFQGNRNPFVDHPEWVDCIYNGVCGSPGSVDAYCFGNATCPCSNIDPFAGCQNSTGVGANLINSLGDASIGTDNLVITAISLPQQQFGLIYMGAGQTASPFGDGLRCVGAGGVGVFRFSVQSSGFAGAIVLGPGIVGTSQTSFPAAGEILAGSSWNFQAWFRDPAGPCGAAFNLSNALAVSFVP